MKKYNIISLTSGKIIATVTANSPAEAKRPYRMCRAEEIKSLLPGEAEYKRFLTWANTLATDRVDWLDQVGYGIGDTIPCVHTWPLSVEETEKAYGYAKFLGILVANDFRSLYENYK